MIKKHDFKELLEIIHFTERVSTKLHGHNEKEIFSIIKEEFRNSKKYNITILEITEDQSFLKIITTTFAFSKKRLADWERIANITLNDFKINLKKSSLFSRAISKNEAFCVSGEKIFKDIFPAKVAELLAEMTGYKYRKTIITPLVIYKNVSGVIAASSPIFSEFFIPTVVHFARHISNAIALSRSEQKYQDLLENINEIIISTDAEGIIHYINPQIRLLGYIPEDYINKPAIEFVYADDRERVARDFQKSMTTGEEFPTEFRMQAKDGKIYWFEDFGKIQYNDTGNIIGLTGILRNITEKKKHEEAIKRLNLAIEQSNDCIAIHKFDGIIYYANNSFLETFKYTKDDLVNKRIKVYNSEQNYKLYLEWLEGIKKKGSWSGQTKTVRKDGTIFHSFMSAKIIYDEKGEPLEILAILKDITEFNKQKADLEKKNIALKEILSQIEIEKKNIKDEIIRNIDKIIIPAMNHLKNNDCIIDELKNYIEKIKTDLRNITSSLSPKSTDVFTKLSPKELEICNMAKNGMKNREIAVILNISLQTVEKHKKNIRKKLGISGQKINLRTFLERL